MDMRSESTVMTFIATRDREQARQFYGTILGFATTHEDQFALVFDLNGIALRITTIANHVAVPHTVLGWAVDDISAAVQSLKSKGAEFSIYEGLGQDDEGIWASPGGGAKVAWFKDPDGNVLSLTQY